MLKVTSKAAAKSGFKPRPLQLRVPATSQVVRALGPPFWRHPLHMLHGPRLERAPHTGGGAAFNGKGPLPTASALLLSCRLKAGADAGRGHTHTHGETSNKLLTFSKTHFS